MAAEKMRDSFITHATDILGDTYKGLSTAQIIKHCNSYAVEFDVEILITTIDFGKFGADVPNKRTALLWNLRKFVTIQSRI